MNISIEDIENLEFMNVAYRIKEDCDNQIISALYWKPNINFLLEYFYSSESVNVVIYNNIFEEYKDKDKGQIILKDCNNLEELKKFLKIE